MSITIKEKDNKIRIKIVKDTRELKVAREVVEKKLLTQNIDKRTILGIKVAMEEAIYNGIIHAYKKSKRIPEVIVDIEINENKIEMEVRDFGEGNEWYKKYKLPSFEREEELFNDGKRGLVLIYYYMDKVIFSSPPDGGTKIKLIKYLKKEGKDEIQP